MNYDSLFLVCTCRLQARIGSVYEDHFLGMAEMFDEMLDSYFQSSLAKVASHSTEIMKGR